MSIQKTSNKKILILTGIIALSLVGISLFSFFTPEVYSNELSTFESYESFFEFLKEQTSSTQGYYGAPELGLARFESTDAMNTLSGDESAGGDDVSYSETNIQVEGVDEPDSVKTDGSYIYVLSDYSFHIIKAYPVENSQLISTISLSEDYWYTSFFINDDSLIVFGESYPNYWYYPEPLLIDEKVESDMGDDEDKENTEEVNASSGQSTEPVIAPTWDVSKAAIIVYDLSDRSQPQLQKTIELEGSFVNARMIGSTVYVVASENTYELYRVMEGTDYFKIPQITVDGESENITAEQIYYVDEPEETDSLTHVLSLDLETLDFSEKSFLIGNTQELYMSSQNIYLVYTSYEYTARFFSSPEFNLDNQITKIHKINIQDGDITYVASGEVPGRFLNQFSMDEHDTYFRITTTTGYLWNEENPSQNHVYILDEDLSIASSITDIASGEELYSARFMGDRAYLVTFKNTDPFFTLDLSDPLNPQILGELKLPGYSDYLHPFDENHIIGIGKEAVASDDPNFAWYQGVKLALFDVSDITNPELVDTEIIGDRGSSTPVLYDHKALLFDRQKELLVLPVSVYEIDNQEKIKDDDPGTYGSFRYQGAYVFQITPDGFTYRDRITHLNESTLNDLQDNSWYRWNDNSFIHRTLYIDNALYTISNALIQAHSLDDLEYLNQVNLS